VREALAHHSALYNLLEYGVLQKLANNTDLKSDEPPDSAIGAEREAVRIRERERAVTAALLQRTRELCEAVGSSLMVVGIPTASQVTGQESRGTGLVSAAEQAGVPLILLSDSFRAESAGTRRSLYLRYNRHWTAEGNDLAAAVVSEQLHERHLVGL
jgi:hypothetical protein